MTAIELNKFFEEMYVESYRAIIKSNMSKYEALEKVSQKYSKKLNDVYKKYYDGDSFNNPISSGQIGIKYIEKDVNEIVDGFKNEIEGSINKILEEVTEESFKTSTNIMNYAFAKNKSNKISNKFKDELLMYRHKGRTIDERFTKLYRDFGYDANSAIIRGVQEGINPRVFAKEIQKLTGKTYSQSVRIAVTEENRIYNQTTFNSYESFGIDKYIIIATLDDRTTPICRRKDGDIIVISDATSDDLPPFHPWCRTTIGAYYDDVEYKRLDNKTKQLVPYVKYDEWNSKYNL